MGYRDVYGEILDPAGNPLQTEVSFTLSDHMGSYDAIAQYPGAIYKVTTLEDGTFTANLWANEEGLRYSEYLCKFKSTWFTFTLPPGDTSISLSELRSRGVAPPPTNPPPINHQRLTILSSGQTSFTLGSAPAEPQNLLLYINGVKAVYSLDYTIDSLTLTWTNSFILTPTDYLEVFYR